MKKENLFVILTGVVIGIAALVLTALGNPANMGFCIACFERDIAGAVGLHSAAKVQYVRPEIIGLVLGSFLMALASKEWKARAGSSPALRFVLGAFVMIGALAFLGCPLRMVLRLAGGDLNAVVGLAGFAAGIFLGTIFIRKGFTLQRNYATKTLDGTVQTLFAHGGGITKFLVQSVATRPDQVQHINEFIAREVAQFPDRLYGFGALHPDSPTLEEDIAHLRALGLHGVKLHPDIQGFRLDDPRCFALAEQCEGVLPLLLHTGDSRYDFSNPNRLIPLLRRFPRLTVIGAHFGGYTIWQEAARQLAGRFENLWVDCSSSFFAMDVAAGRALIDAYGADRVLFGTDYPMWDPQHELARLRGMHLAPETERKILYDNAAALFGLEGEN